MCIRDRVGEYIIELDNFIGEGQFGKVYRGHHEQTKEVAAVKVISLKELETSKETMLQRELETMDAVSKIQKERDTPNVVRLHDVKRTANNIYIVMEYCEGEDLEEFLSQKAGKKVSEAEGKEIMKQLLSGYDAIHQAGAVHRDIKFQNIISSNGVWKLADFGFSRFIPDNDFLTSYKGSPLFMPPQILVGAVTGKTEPYTYKCDIWSLGILWYIIVIGEWPFKASSKKELYEKITKNPVTFPSNCGISADAQALMKQMIATKESDRIDWEPLRDHPYWS
eukprot:TRINITY_DN3520_c0_g2_i5.p1 TRINITY_DN3520_c0_g2~~TRINITY_DN3520_c0_g2_i5.p1  ORF type:complete len:280 (-),score=61.00 TRINITY_DN3520_c0_g2_i5:126-965(-)